MPIEKSLTIRGGLRSSLRASAHVDRRASPRDSWRGTQLVVVAQHRRSVARSPERSGGGLVGCNGEFGSRGGIRGDDSVAPAAANDCPHRPPLAPAHKSTRGASAGNGPTRFRQSQSLGSRASVRAPPQLRASHCPQEAVCDLARVWPRESRA